MNLEITNIVFALLMLAVSAAAIIWALKTLASGSEHRMTRMIARVGLGSGTVNDNDPDVREAIDALRRRCRKCQTEDVCERWLANKTEGENNFCPNAEVFTQLKGLSSAA